MSSTVPTPTPDQPRTAVVPLEGGGRLLIPCPAWCEGHPDVLMYPTDVAHSSTETPVNVTLENGGEVELLALAIEQAPFATVGPRGAGAMVFLAGEYYRLDVPGLYALAAQIADRVPAALRALADQLAAILEDGGRE